MQKEKLTIKKGNEFHELPWIVGYFTFDEGWETLAEFLFRCDAILFKKIKGKQKIK
jgi:hypothetical protein